ncbi:hypothetical protein SASPL_107195 [Salvia splendens]|uniref:Bifunctional inhibitor/plant lipid transfer protein/seed storage helical domain-containing protein n=1 Tax=Salvia splendens TaxID=180675 RepID=A0A8X8YGC9_SALSN|nr:uncharacterized protein LOC121795639 [Salvia splendens]KAG6429153.1 hypothetical protein SASPL_107195 [Salvia splendens]
MAMKLLAATILIVSLSTSQAHWHPRRPTPLCVSQLAIVNRACGRLPYARVNPPSLPSPPAREGEGEVESGHHHHHHHRQPREGYVETAQEGECCRWVKEVDTECVCDLLVHLPPFMTRPLHEYKVIVDDSCEVSFSCASRLVNF